jgi:hypothetical protein
MICLWCLMMIMVLLRSDPSSLQFQHNIKNIYDIKITSKRVRARKHTELEN